MKPSSERASHVFSSITQSSQTLIVYWHYLDTFQHSFSQLHALPLPLSLSLYVSFSVLLLLLSLANIVCLPAVNKTISLEPKFERQTTRRAAPSTYFFLTPCQTIAATPIVNITTPSASPPNSSSSLTLTLMRVFGIELRATLYAARQRKSITVGIQSGNTLTTT